MTRRIGAAAALAVWRNVRRETSAARSPESPEPTEPTGTTQPTASTGSTIDAPPTRTVDVDPEHLPQQVRFDVLRIPTAVRLVPVFDVSATLIVAVPSISERHVQEPVRPCLDVGYSAEPLADYQRARFAQHVVSDRIGDSVFNAKLEPVP